MTTFEWIGILGFFAMLVGSVMGKVKEDEDIAIYWVGCTILGTVVAAGSLLYAFTVEVPAVAQENARQAISRELDIPLTSVTLDEKTIVCETSYKYACYTWSAIFTTKNGYRGYVKYDRTAVQITDVTANGVEVPYLNSLYSLENKMLFRNSLVLASALIVILLVLWRRHKVVNKAFVRLLVPKFAIRLD